MQTSRRTFVSLASDLPVCTWPTPGVATPVWLQARRFQKLRRYTFAAEEALGTWRLASFFCTEDPSREAGVVFVGNCCAGHRGMHTLCRASSALRGEKAEETAPAAAVRGEAAALGLEREEAKRKGVAAAKFGKAAVETSSPQILPTPFVARGRFMPGQRLLPCTKEDTEILVRCQGKYVSPQDVEGGIVVRVLSAKDAQRVTSPVLRVVRNRQFGIRKGERTQLALFGGLFVCAFASLGLWQLRRMEEKKQIIAHRRQNLAKPPTEIRGSPFPWTLEAAACSGDSPFSSPLGSETLRPDGSDDSGSSEDRCEPSSVEPVASGAKAVAASSSAEERISAAAGERSASLLLKSVSSEAVQRAVHAWAYRPVVVRGVLDGTTELLVGPRPGLELGSPGYCVVSPLRCADGSVILVNKGHLPYKLAKLPPFQEYCGEAKQPPFQESNPKSTRTALQYEKLNESLYDLHNSNSSRPYLNPGYSQSLENVQLLVGCRSEPVDTVTVRGVLEPGELVTSGFKAFMLQNRPQDCAFVTVNPKDLANATPGVPNLTECSLMMINAYSITYDRDVNDTVTNGMEAKSNNSIFLPDACGKGSHKSSNVRNRFASYQQKQKEDYLLFYADEHTHFNYACQWFLMGICTAAMTIYKLIEVSRWRW